MGKIIELDKGRIKPIETGLLFHKASRFLQSYLSDPSQVIVPVRENPFREGMILLDGNHRSCMTQILSEAEDIPLYGWVADNEEDFPSSEDLPYWIKNENRYIDPFLFSARKWIKDNFIAATKIYYDDTPQSIQELRNTCEHLSSPKRLLTYFLTPSEFEVLRRGKSKNLIDKISGNYTIKPEEFRG